MPWTFEDFDLTNWKLQLPVDDDYFAPDGGDGDPYDDDSAEVKGEDFVGFEDPNFFFYDDVEGAFVFRTPVLGATTSSNTRYARTELREMDGTSGAAWSVSDGAAMSATLKVTEMPTRLDGNESRIVVAQIKSSDELTRLYYESDGDLYFFNEVTGPDLAEIRFYFEDENGNRPNVALAEVFSYNINVTDGALYVEVIVDGVTYSPVPTDDIDPTLILPYWHDQDLYFKTGIYQGVTSDVGYSSEGTGQAEAYFYAVDFDHAGTVTEEDDVLVGGDPNNLLVGKGGHDEIAGGAGDDTIFGGADHDTLEGGAGDDALSGDDGDDVIFGGAGADMLDGGSGDDLIVADDMSAADVAVLLADLGIAG